MKIEFKKLTLMPYSLSLSSIFCDHMVFLRNKPLRVWGAGTVGAWIKVSLLQGQHTLLTERTQVDLVGRWQLHLPSLSAGGPFQLKVEQGNTSLLIDDILVGDIWLASGQSNMEWKLSWQTDDWQQEVANSENTQIRFFELSKTYSATPQDNIPAGVWKTASPATSGDFSAVAWHFAKRYQQHTGIPLGIIDSSWGGTPAEAWTSLEALVKIKAYQKDAQDMQKNGQRWQQEFSRNDELEKQKWQIIDSSSAFADGKVLAADFDDSTWSTVNLPKVQDQVLRDIVWARKHVQIGTLPRSVTLDMGELYQIARVFVNGQQVYKKGWQDFTERVDIPSNILKIGDNVIVVRLANSGDNTLLIGKAERFNLVLDYQNVDLSGPWQVSNTIEPKIPDVKSYKWKPGVLYNAMIHPLVNFPISGVIWYQGENNVGTHALYNELFKTLITDWRAQWHEPELPFLFVQLASHLKQKSQANRSDWALLREAQACALTLPNTGMAVTIDIGDADDIHPRNKADVGERLWRVAQHVVLKEPVSYSGPSLTKVEAKLVAGKNVLVLSYRHIDGGLKVKGQALLGFALASTDGQFFNAQAQIDGDTIIVSSPKVKQPNMLRYAWADNSPANLYNSAGLPAVPTRYTLANS
jgi:sialate O-acetylesterase